MKKCTWCGKEYPDEATVCSVDAMQLEQVTRPPPPADEVAHGATGAENLDTRVVGWTQAERVCAEGVELRRAWAQSPILIGTLQRAQTAFQRAVELSPTLWKGHYGLGEILLLRQDTKPEATIRQGLQEVWTAAHLAPHQSEPPVQLVAALSSINLDVAEQFYYYATHSSAQQAGENMYPDAWQAGKYWRFAINAAEGGSCDVAIYAFRRALKLEPQYHALAIDLPIANECLKNAKGSGTFNYTPAKESDLPIVAALPMLPEDLRTGR